MEQNFNRRIETDLDLNGPNLAVSSQPSDATVANGASQTFSVTVTASFPGNSNPDNEGTLTYQWYLNDDGNTTSLTNEGQYSGTTTATLTVSDIESPDNNGNKYYCVIDYTPAEKYGEDGKGTGHPINGAITSDSATLTVNPFIVIANQPASVDREYNVNGEITVVAELSDSSYPNDIGYQWLRNANPISDGTVTTTRIERGTVIDVVVETEEKEVVTVKRHNYSFSQTYTHAGSNPHTPFIPGTATNVRVELAGAGGGKGGTDARGNGGEGGNGNYGVFEILNAAGGTLTFRAGKKGSDGTQGGGRAGGQGGGFPNYGSGGKGGSSGHRGSSGSGGGGGGTSDVIKDGTTIIITGGGGGGGGASHVRLHGGNGTGANIYNEPFKGVNYTIFSDGGHGGHPCERADGGGGGGGGAGWTGSSAGIGAGAGGAGGGDGYRGGLGGEGGRGAYRTDYVNKLSDKIAWNNGQGYIKLTYDYYIDVYDTKTETITTQREVEREIVNSIPQNLYISGTKGKTLTVKADYNTVENLKCIVSSPTATNSPVTTNTAQFSSFSNLADKRLYLEEVFWDNGTATASLSTIDLNNGPLELTLDDGSSGSGLNIFTCFYTTEDMYITMEMQGGTGLDYVQPAGVVLPTQSQYGYAGGGIRPGGRGGYGRLDMKIKAYSEFTIAGLFNGVNTPFFYYKEYLIAVVGEGGQGGCYGIGGAGGGMSQAGWGSHGEGPNGGKDGFDNNGSFGTANGGGGAPGGRQTYDGIIYNTNPCYSAPPVCNYITQVGYIGSHFQSQNWNDFAACEGPEQQHRCDKIAQSNYGGRTKAISKNNLFGRNNSGYNSTTRKIKMRDGTILNNTASIARGFADIEGAFLGTAGRRKNDGLGGRGGNGALGGEGSGGGKGGGGGSGFLADIAMNKNIGFKEFDGVKFYKRADTGKIDDGGAKVKISLDTTGNY